MSKIKPQSFKHHPSLVTHRDLFAICSPLYAKNIKIMNFIRVTSDQKVTYLCDHHDWLLHYLNKGYPQIGAFEQKQVVISGDYVLWSALQDTDPIVIDSREIFNIRHGITLMRTHPEGHDFFNFGVSESASAVKEKLQAQVKDLQHFIDDFYAKTKRLLSRVQKTAFNLQDFSDNKEESHSLNSNFYLGPKYNHQYLTRREIECLIWLVKGKATPAIALILNLSTRTVEKHIENIKRKLDCHTQCQLGYILAKLDIADLDI